MFYILILIPIRSTYRATYRGNEYKIEYVLLLCYIEFMKTQVKAITIGFIVSAIFMFVLVGLIPIIKTTNVIYDCEYWNSLNEEYAYSVINSKGEEIQVKRNKVFYDSNPKLKENYVYVYLKEITSSSLFKNATFVNYEFYIVDYLSL